MAIQSSLKMDRAMFINTLNTILVSYTVGIVFWNFLCIVIGLINITTKHHCHL